MQEGIILRKKRRTYRIALLAKNNLRALLEKGNTKVIHHLVICGACEICLQNQTSCWSFMKKETLPQVFSFEFCKISKSTFFTELYTICKMCIQILHIFIYIYKCKIIHTTIVQWKKIHNSYYWNLEIWFLTISSLFGFCTLRMFSGKLGITGIGSAALQEAHLFVSCIISFR